MTGQDTWERWQIVWHGLFGVLLMICILFIAVPSVTAPLDITLLYSGVFVLWYVGQTAWLERTERVRMPFVFAYTVVGLLIWFVLSDLGGSFMFMLFFLFPYLFMTLELRWAIPTSLILSGLTITRLTLEGNADFESWVILIVLATFVGILFAYFVDDVIRQSQQRQSLINTLERTRRELAQAERQAGILQERQRLAHEIHDTLAQGFTSIITHLQAAENTAHIPEQRQAHLAQAQQTARASLTEARRFVWDLRPDVLDNRTLETGLEHVLSDWQTATQKTADLVTTGRPVTLHPAVEVALLRVTQEALANVQKHAHASRVTVTLSYIDSTVIMDIQDDGVGFDPTNICKRPSSGFGLSGMRRRIETLGGTFTVESAYSDGTTVVVTLPVTPA